MTAVMSAPVTTAQPTRAVQTRMVFRISIAISFALDVAVVLVVSSVAFAVGRDEADDGGQNDERDEGDEGGVHLFFSYLFGTLIL